MNIRNEIMNANPKAAKAVLYIEGELSSNAAQDLIDRVADLEKTWSDDPVPEEYAGIMGIESKSFADYVREDAAAQMIGLAHRMWIDAMDRDDMIALLSGLVRAQVLGDAKYDSCIWEPQRVLDLLDAWNQAHEEKIYAETIGYDLP